MTQYTETVKTPRLAADAKNYRYVVFAMVVIITAVNYIDRGAISYAAGPITKAFGFSASAWGNVLGYFGYGYMAGALLGGVLADRKGPKWVWIVAGSSWSVFEAVTALAGHLGQAFFGGSALAGFAVMRIVFGFAEGPAFSTINRTLANWGTVRERGFTQSLGLLGTPVGALLAAPVAVGLITLTGSWQWAFVILGVAGLLWVLVWRRMFTDMPEDSSRVSAAELARIRATAETLPGENSLAADTGRHPWTDFFRSPTLVCNAFGYFAFQYVNFMILTWTPKYLEDQFGFKFSALWYLGMVPWIGSCFTILLGGRISDWLRRRTKSLWIARSGFAAVSLMLTTICFSLIPLMPNASSALALMAVGNALNSLPNIVYWIVIIDTAPSRAGTFGGISHFITNIATIVAPTLTGYLVAAHGYSAMFVSTAVATAFGMTAMLFVRPGVRAKALGKHLGKKN